MNHAKQYAEWFDLGAYYMTDWVQVDKLDVLNGHVAFEDAAPDIQALTMPEFTEGAKEILQLPTKDARRKALATLPDKVRPKIEKEIMRIWENGR